MVKQIVRQGIPLVLVILLGTAMAACDSQPKPDPTYTRYPTYTPAPTLDATGSPQPVVPQSAPPTPAGAAPSRPTPTAKESPLAAERTPAISNGVGHTCILQSDGSPFCWGIIRYTVLTRDAYGRGAYQGSEPPDEKFTAISVGQLHVCALRLDGSPFCWGEDNYGEA